MQLLNEKKVYFMGIYESYTNQLTRALREKTHNINLLAFIKEQKREKDLKNSGKALPKNVTRSPMRAPSKYLSSEKLRALTKRVSKTPIK